MVSRKIPRFLRSDLAAYSAWVLSWFLVLALGMSLVGCQTDRVSLPPEARAEWDRLTEASQAAALTPEVEDDLAAEADWGEFESRMAKEQAAPFAGLLPYGLGAIGLELVGVFASRRKRKLYAEAIKNISKGQVAASVGDALKAWGAQHSSPQQPSPQPPSEA